MLLQLSKRAAPIQYPHLLFHALRCTQLICALIVGPIMIYFDWHLTSDRWNVPWTFIILTAVAFLNIIFLVASVALHCAIGLDPRLNAIFNVIIIVLWGMGFGLLSWWARSTLGNSCSLENWTDSTGVMVCNTYKALFAFTIFCFLATVAAFILDIYVYKTSMERGYYDAMHTTQQTQGVTGQFRDDKEDIVLIERIPPRAFSRQRADSKGYRLPDGQFANDTAYRGREDAASCP